jgi:branched-chain amino acid transport system ATP-binding protein
MTDLIRTEGLTKQFDGLVAVNQVNFHVEDGQAAGVIGPNGSGKTTLFNLLSGLLPPTAGSISFRGKDVTNTAPHKRVEMGMTRTFQLVSVFDSLTAWENLVLSTMRFKSGQRAVGKFYAAPAQRKEILVDCHDALKMVGLESKASSLTSELSYGDKRMIEIAIALSLKPKLLLLDEPLSGLSDHEIGQVLDLIHRVKADFSLVIIEHKISRIIDLVNRLSVMNEGSFICEGQPDEVLSDPGVRECYFGKEDKNC